MTAKDSGYIRRFLKGVQAGPFRFLVPGAAVAAVTAMVVSGYTPLQYQPAQAEAQAQKASADLGKQVKVSEDGKASAGKGGKVHSTPAVSSSAELADGTYTGYDRCAEDDIFDYYVAVDVTIKGGKVAKVSNVRGTGTGNKGSANLGTYDTINDTYLEWAADGRGSQTGVLAQIRADAAKGTITSDIDAVSGATYSSKSVLRAYYDALAKAAEASGSKSKVEIPSAKSVAKEGSETSSSSSSGTHVEADLPADDGTVTYRDGTYTAYAICEDTENPSAYKPYYIGATIEVKDGKVTTLSDAFGDAKGVVDPKYLYDPAENLYYLNRAKNGYGISGKHPGVVKQVNTALATGSLPTGIDTISGATYSSLSIFTAFANAVKLAQADATDDAGAVDAADETGTDADASADGESTDGAGGASGEEAVQ